MSAENLLLYLLIFGFPFLAIWLSNRYKLASFLSPIVLCFAIGIIIALIPTFSIDLDAVKKVRDPAILLSLPLLLFSSDLMMWIRNSRQLIYGYMIAVLVTVFAVTFSAISFQHVIPEVWSPGAMMVGIHTGGTQNLMAVAMGTGADDTAITLTNSAQIMWGAIHLLFLLTAGHRIYQYFLGSSPDSPIEIDGESYVSHDKIKFLEVLYAMALASFIIAISVLVSYQIFGSLHVTFVIVSITTLAILSSLIRQVRSWNGSFEAGDYFLLVFGIALGLSTEIGEVIAKGGYYLFFIGLIFLLTLLFMLILCRLFSVKKDTAVIAITAAIYGPPFIPQVAQVLRNRSIIPGGIAISLIGLALGNYIGLTMYSILKALLQ